MSRPGVSKGARACRMSGVSVWGLGLDAPRHFVRKCACPIGWWVIAPDFALGNPRQRCELNAGQCLGHFVAVSRMSRANNGNTSSFKRCNTRRQPFDAYDSSSTRCGKISQKGTEPRYRGAGQNSGVLHKTLNYPWNGSTVDLTSRDNFCSNTLRRVLEWPTL